MELRQVKGTRNGKVFVATPNVEVTIDGTSVVRVELGEVGYVYSYRTPYGAAIGVYNLVNRMNVGFVGGVEFDFYPPTRTPCDTQDSEFESRVGSIELICNGVVILVAPEDLPFEKTWQ